MGRSTLAAGAALALLTVAGGAGATLALARAVPATPGGPSGWRPPVDAAVVTQGFGCTAFVSEPLDRLCPGGHRHTGIDLAAPLGTPVHAATDGIVRIVAAAGGYGLHVLLDAGDALVTVYAHLSAVDVVTGDAVAAGAVIGVVGSTGNSTGPHLHFEVRRDGIAEDPLLDLHLP